jgi:hypothetical protein
MCVLGSVAPSALSRKVIPRKNKKIFITWPSFNVAPCFENRFHCMTRGNSDEDKIPIFLASSFLFRCLLTEF